VRDLPVGEFLGDHPIVSFTGTFANGEDFSTVYFNFTQKTFKTYLKGEVDGILSETGVGPYGFFVSKGTKPTWPDIALSGMLTADRGGQKILTELLVYITRPKSKGTLGFNVKAYLAGEEANARLAQVDFNFLSVREDGEKLIEGIV
jgi:hypothetical protein